MPLDKSLVVVDDLVARFSKRDQLSEHEHETLNAPTLLEEETIIPMKRFSQFNEDSSGSTCYIECQCGHNYSITRVGVPNAICPQCGNHQLRKVTTASGQVLLQR